MGTDRNASVVQSDFSTKSIETKSWMGTFSLIKNKWAFSAFGAQIQFTSALNITYATLARVCQNKNTVKWTYKDWISTFKKR